MTARADLGAFGERVAAHHLEAAGLTVIARNLRVPSGEVDILAREGDELVFVEVRTRRAVAGAAAESVVSPKLARMWRCVFDYCDTHGTPIEQARVDLVAIDLDAAGRVTAVAHLRALDAPET